MSTKVLSMSNISDISQLNFSSVCSFRSFVVWVYTCFWGEDKHVVIMLTFNSSCNFIYSWNMLFSTLLELLEDEMSWFYLQMSFIYTIVFVYNNKCLSKEKLIKVLKVTWRFCSNIDWYHDFKKAKIGEGEQEGFIYLWLALL